MNLFLCVFHFTFNNLATGKIKAEIHRRFFLVTLREIIVTNQPNKESENMFYYPLNFFFVCFAAVKLLKEEKLDSENAAIIYSGSPL